MSVKEDQDLAVQVAGSLVSHGCDQGPHCMTLDTGVIEIQYSIGGRAQPPVRVHKKSIVFPAGSQHDLMWKVLGA